MGISLSKRVFVAQQLPDRAYAVQGEETAALDSKRLLRFIRDGFLAPIWSRERAEDPESVRG